MSTLLSTKTFHFELVSPEKVLVSEEVAMVEIPGEAGNFGVLADHAPLLSSIRPGIVIVTMADGSEKKIFVAGGFADVNATMCSVLAEQAVNLNEINRAEVETQIKDLQDDFTFAKNDPIKQAILQKQIRVAQAKIEAVNEPVH